MVLVVCGIKGGAGKSLITANLTVLSAQTNQVLLVDGDDQATVSDWVEHRLAMGVTTNWTTIRLRGSSVRTEVIKLVENYDHVIIDCGGRDTSSLRAALTICDIALMPFQPKSFDIWTGSKMAEIIDEAKCLNPNLKALAFINCAGSRGTDNSGAQNILSKIEGLDLLDVTVGLRKSFSNATSEGLGIVEVLRADPKAVGEIKKLYSQVFDTKNTTLKHNNLAKNTQNICNKNTLNTQNMCNKSTL